VPTFKSFRSRASLVTIMFALVLFTGACGGASTPAATSTSGTSASATSTTAAATDKEPYKIGALFAVTGFNSPLGVPQKQTVEMLVDDINAKGGINGHPLQVVIYDTESDETKAVTLAKRLIEQDQVSAIIGPSSTGESLALVDTVQKAGIPMVSCATSIKIVQPIKPYVYKVAPSDIQVAQTLTEYMKGKGLTKVALLASSGGFGTTGKAALDEAAKAAGITIVASESFGDKDTDMSVQLTKIKGTDAQAIIVWGTNPGPAIISKNAQTLGIKIPIYNSHGIANQTFIDLAGTAGEGMIFPAGNMLVAKDLPDSNAQKAVLMAYGDEYQKKYGKAADTLGGHAYDALSMVAKAMETAGADKGKIRDALETMQFVGISGIFQMTPQDHNGLGKTAIGMVEIKNGQWTPAP
jgi:branched-chain amino acid transport system substrate-binding protein